MDIAGGFVWHYRAGAFLGSWNQPERAVEAAPGRARKAKFLSFGIMYLSSFREDFISLGNRTDLAESRKGERDASTNTKILGKV